MTRFEGLVDDYDAGRPDYPAALHDALPLAGARVLEVGAGTGKATAGLVRRGAHVLATDPGPRMLARLHAVLPTVPAALARAEQLPVRDSSFDVVLAAQCWHWTDAPVAAAEALRVLRPGGTLALVWNEVDADGEPWWELQQELLLASGTGYTRGFRERSYGDDLAGFLDVRHTTLSWSRTLTLPLYERWLRSKSYVDALPDTEAFVAASLAALREAFPSGQVREPFRVSLWTARRP